MSAVGTGAPRGSGLDDAAVGVALGLSSLSLVSTPLWTALADHCGDAYRILLAEILLASVLVFMQVAMLCHCVVQVVQVALSVERGAAVWSGRTARRSRRWIAFTGL